jgi:hypothetical protein
VTYMDALGNLARSDVPNRAELIKRNVDRYLKDKLAGGSGPLSGFTRLSTMKRLNDVTVRIGAWRRIMFARCKTWFRTNSSDAAQSTSIPFLSVNR